MAASIHTTSTNAVTPVWGLLRLAPNHCYTLFCTVGYNRECLVSSFSNQFTEISGKFHKGKFPQYTHWVGVTCSFISRYPATRKQPKSDEQMSNVWTRLEGVSTHTLNAVRLVFFCFQLSAYVSVWVRMCQSECICVSLSAYAVSLSAYVSVWVHMLSSVCICMCLHVSACDTSGVNVQWWRRCTWKQVCPDFRGLKWRGSTVVTEEDKNVPVHQSCIQFHLVVQQGPGEMLALLVLSLNRKKKKYVQFR